MSVEALKWAWEQQGLSPAEKIVLLCLGDHADDLGENCWPGQARISRKAGVSRETVSRSAKFFETVQAVDKSGQMVFGIIKILKTPIPDMGAVYRNNYKLLLDRVILRHTDVTNRGVGDVTNSQVHVTTDHTVCDDRSHGACDVRSHNPSSEELSEEFKIKKTSFPLNYQLNESLLQFCTSQQILDPTLQLEAFRDYHVAKGSRFTDWDAAFRTWIRNSRRFDHGSVIKGVPSKAERIRQATAETLRRGL